ncbi:B12-binding domain-containing radical SAM protein [Patescibacteria group bacterium]|nr:B12-binding domain-containing radical SAM protein [Patescibacteria group bacterium]
MKILLIDILDNENKIQTKYYSLGLGYLVSFLPKDIREKIDIKIINNQSEKEIDFFKPDIVGLSCVSQNFNRAKEIAKFCKERNIIVIIGKGHISSIPECLDKNMDIGIIGEGEQTFSEIVEMFIKKEFTQENLKKIKGIIFHSENNLIQTQARPLISDLDSIPFPDRALLNIKKGDNFYMFTSRGCPYKCRFCFSSRFWGKVRFHSAKYVVDEIKYLIDHYKPLRITFCDDLFIADIKRLREIVELIKEQKFYKKVKFTISARANLINDNSVKLIKEMGADIVCLGLESGNETVLKFLKDDLANMQDNIAAIKYLKKYNLQVSASFIIGSPSETREQILETLDFIKKSKLDLFEINVLLPLPGTPIWEDALQKGLVSVDMDWSKLNGDFLHNYKNYIILSEKLDRYELKYLYSLFLKERKKRRFKLLIKYIFTRPKEIIFFIKNKLKRKFVH